MLFDTHVHLNSEEYKNVNEVIERARENGVTKMVVVGYDLESSIKAVEIASNFDFIYASIGIHPSEAKKAKISDFEAIEAMMNNEKVVAVGEIGLDYHWDSDNKEQQKDFFVRQLKLASKHKKPVVIHSRDAAQDTYDILKENKFMYEKGIMHCYSYSKEMAELFVGLGLSLAFGGALTFTNAKENKLVVENTSIKNLLLETDAPYLTPHPFRGKLNEPKYIYLVAEKIAEIKKIKKEEVERITYENACNLFGIEK